jgi:hypothetical protein
VEGDELRFVSINRPLSGAHPLSEAYLCKVNTNRYSFYMDFENNSVILDGSEEMALGVPSPVHAEEIGRVWRAAKAAVTAERDVLGPDTTVTVSVGMYAGVIQSHDYEKRRQLNWRLEMLEAMTVTVLGIEMETYPD